MGEEMGENETMAINTITNNYSGIKKQMMGATATSKVWERPEEEDSDSDPVARGSDEPTNEGTRSRHWGSESSGSDGPANGTVEG